MVYVCCQGQIQGGPRGPGPPRPPKMRPQHQNSTKLRPQNGSFRLVTIWAPPRSNPGSAPDCIYCIRTLHDQMHLSLFGEAVHLPGIDCLHGAAQACSPCRSNRDPKVDPLNSGSPTVQWQPKG